GKRVGVDRGVGWVGVKHAHASVAWLVWGWGQTIARPASRSSMRLRPCMRPAGVSSTAACLMLRGPDSLAIHAPFALADRWVDPTYVVAPAARYPSYLTFS